RLRERALASSEGGHRVRQDVGAWAAQAVHGLRAHQQCLSRVQAARDADHYPVHTRELEPLGQALDLNLVNLGTPLITPAWIGGHVREALKTAGRQQQLARARKLEVKVHGAEGIAVQPLALDALAEGVLPHTFLADALQ